MAKSKDQLFAKIDNLLFDINSKYTRLKSDEELDAVELTLLDGDIRYLSTHIKALEYFVEPVGKQQEQVAESASITFTPETQLTEKLDSQPVFEEIDEVQVPSVEERSDEPAMEFSLDNVEQDRSQQDREEEPVVSVYEEPIVHEVVEEEKVLIVETPPVEKEIQEEQPARPLTINELIHQQRLAGVNMTQQFQTSSTQERVSDLKNAVSLNDKLLFIKDLFNGYSLAYSEALELLNRLNNFAEADAFLQSNYALKNGWADKPQTVDKFYVLLRKKFSN